MYRYLIIILTYVFLTALALVLLAFNYTLSLWKVKKEIHAHYWHNYANVLIKTYLQHVFENKYREIYV